MLLHLKRVTTSQAYLPFVDGLRFFVILPVVMVHFVDYYEAHTAPIRQTALYNRLHLDSVFGSSENSLLVFFAISGFILGLPFAKSLLTGQPYPKLGAFYLRRITRLEPPYLLLLTALLVLNVFWIQRDTFSNTFGHYLASFFYLHNILYQSHPTLNFVFWTLEIEVQFYLLAPFLAHVFALPALKRRVLLVVTIFVFGLVNFYFHTPFLSLFNYLHYFLAGFLALDLFLTGTFKKSYVFDILCFPLALVVYTGLADYGVLLPYLIASLIYLSSLSVIWQKLLTLKWVTIIGGMCYSIYMLHHPAMAVLLNRLIPAGLFANSLWLDFTARLGLMLLLVLGVSATYFVLVERPCMKRDWYKKVLRIS